MTKAATVGLKRRRKRVGRPKANVNREPNGRAQRPTVAEQADSATETAATARLRILGTRDSPEARKAALSPLCGDPLGLCLVRLMPDPRRQMDLWGVWHAMSQAKRNWQQRITGTNPNPQSAAIAMLPDAMQTDDAHSIDTRTAEERDRGAIRAWDYWLALLMDLPPAERHALRGHLDGYGLPLWAEARPTRAGIAAVAGLKAVAAMHA
jgi:hypothetical protein